jgi:hypothetical protein
VITERTLRNWRKDALNCKVMKANLSPESLNTSVLYIEELHQRILRLTQDLLDIQLMRKR